MLYTVVILLHFDRTLMALCRMMCRQTQASVGTCIAMQTETNLMITIHLCSDHQREYNHMKVNSAIHAL